MEEAGFWWTKSPAGHARGAHTVAILTLNSVPVPVEGPREMRLAGAGGGGGWMRAEPEAVTTLTSGLGGTLSQGLMIISVVEVGRILKVHAPF